MKTNPPFEEKNAIAKLWLKITDPRGYSKYKKQLKEYEQRRFTESFETYNISSLNEKWLESPALNVVHSGNSGDIIYSLPTLKRLFELLGKKSNYYLKLNEPLNIDADYSHPLGNVMLNEKMAEMLNPLLRSQTYISNCLVYQNSNNVDLNLDNFRRSGLLVDRGDIARWCGYSLGINPQLHLPWLLVEPDKAFRDSIVIARSERYRNPLINYSYLNRYSNLVFVGVESEYNDIRRTLPKIEWVQVQDFKRLAEVIAGSKLFIGNQSFPFSIAEGLKVLRILELYWQSPNVIPGGENGFDVMYQKHFEWLVKDLLIKADS